MEFTRTVSPFSSSIRPRDVRSPTGIHADVFMIPSVTTVETVTFALKVARFNFISDSTAAGVVIRPMEKDRFAS